MIRHLAAIDERRGLAKAGVLPWHLPGDTRHYRALAFAAGSQTLMGYKTYLQVKDLLGECDAYVLSRNHSNLPNVTVVADLDAFLDQHRDLWIIGGAGVFELSLDRADELYLTEIHADFICDQFYPTYTPPFKLRERSTVQNENGIDYVFTVYSRERNP